MIKRVNKVVLTILLSIFFSLSPAIADTLKITHAYIPDAPPMVKVMAAYMTIENTSNKAVTVFSFDSPVFGKIEIHETTMKDGMMGMDQLPEIEIPAKSKVKLKPGGKHLMLFARKRDLKLNDKLSITLHSTQGKYKIPITVKQMAGDDSHQHMHH